ncbi:MAG: GNAT family N-acetyltransferase [Acidimicrobiia bacterium]
MIHSDPLQRRTIATILKDGTVAELRPLTADDADLLREGLENMSEESRRLRFGLGLGHLTDAEVEYLTDVDQRTHVAWGATIGGRPAGIGRYICLDTEGCAEIAVTIVDEFQRRGLGRALLGALTASARANEVDEFCFAVEPDNEAVLRILQGIETHIDEADGLVEGTIRIEDLAPSDVDPALVELLGEYQD